jgi:hypothetical protein
LKECKDKCIDPSHYYKDPELTRGESLCLQRCGEKLFATLEVASAELAKNQPQIAGQQLPQK